jgi:hypothetical protein
VRKKLDHAPESILDRQLAIGLMALVSGSDRSGRDDEANRAGEP